MRARVSAFVYACSCSFARARVRVYMCSCVRELFLVCDSACMHTCVQVCVLA